MDDPVPPAAAPPRRARQPRQATADRRAEILRAAARTFGSKGYKNGSLAEVAEQVGITHAGVLHHFGSKEQLLVEVLEYRDKEDVRDLEGLARDCAVARSLGLRGKALVHPDQIAPTHEAFAPTAGELRRAREIVAAYDRAVGEGRGVVALDGDMIDAPVAERARELLNDEKRSVLHAE